MSKFKRTNKLKMEQVLVPFTNVGEPSGLLIGAGTAYNILNGQVGAMSFDFDASIPLGEFIPAGTTFADVPSIKIVQGTGKSNAIHRADVFEAGEKDAVKSGVIKGDLIQYVSTTRFDLGSYSIVSVEDVPVPSDNTLYAAYIRTLSVRRDRDYGDNDDVAYASVETPNYTALAVANPLDHLLQTMVMNINGRSVVTASSNGGRVTGNKPFVAMGINTAGGSGTIIGTLTMGTLVTYQDRNGTLSQITVDAALLTALARLIADPNSSITAASTIEIVDPTVAGTAATVDAFVVVGLDEQNAAYFDDVAFNRTNVEVNLAEAFLGVVPVTVVKHTAASPTNTGREMLIHFRNRAGLQVHTMQNQPFGDFFSRGPEYVKEDENYNVTIIEYDDYEATLTGTVHTPSLAIIPVPAEITNPGITATAVATNITNNNQPIPTTNKVPLAVAGLNATLGAWLTSANVPKYKGVAAPGVIFV